MADDSKVGIATTLSKDEQRQECLNDLLRHGALVTGHSDVEGVFIHSAMVVEMILKFEGKLAQAEAEKNHLTDEYAKVMVQWSQTLTANEKEIKTLKEKLAGYEAAAPEVRALHAECQQVKARLHAFEQRYGQDGDRGTDIIHQFNQGIGHHRELEKVVADLKAQVKQQALNMTTVMDEKDEALRELISVKAELARRRQVAERLKNSRKQKAT